MWHVVNLQRSVREWAMRQGWGGRNSDSEGRKNDSKGHHGLQFRGQYPRIAGLAGVLFCGSGRREQADQCDPPCSSGRGRPLSLARTQYFGTPGSALSLQARVPSVMLRAFLQCNDLRFGVQLTHVAGQFSSLAP